MLLVLLVTICNIGEFFEDPNSINCCCIKYKNSFVNNHYNHTITENLNIANNVKLRQLISKGPQYQESKQINFEKACEETQTHINQFNEIISNGKGIYKNHF